MCSRLIRLNTNLMLNINFRIASNVLKPFLKNTTHLCYFSTSISKHAEKLKLKYETGTLELDHKMLARMADSSATGKYNETNVLVTIVNKARPTAASFLPLTIVCSLLSYDGKDNSDVLCINTVSYALYHSSLEWGGPIGCVRVGMVDNKYVCNPSKKQLEKSPINLVVSVAPNKNIIMIEGWGDNFEQTNYINALEFGAQEAFNVVKKIRSQQGEKKSQSKANNSKEIIETSLSETTSSSSLLGLDKKKFVEIKFFELGYAKIYDILTDSNHDKQSRDDAISQVKNTIVNSLLKNELKTDSIIFNYNYLSELFTKFVKKSIHQLIFDENKRIGSRSLDELRPISCKIDMFNSLHGSALFQRGQTQVLASVTFDSLDSMYRSDSVAQMMSPSLTNFTKNFMLHYEFPSFATNEIARIGGRADRREIGHGALAEKGVYPIFPDKCDFTVRSLCEVLESNGSSSMASVCATSLALMDAGVPIKEHVCGVAMGIIVKYDEKNSPNPNEYITDYKILTDISGMEDFFGDMDFKVSGTKTGITAIQADFKIAGLPFEIVKETLEKSQDARKKILEIMNQTISEPRKVKKPNHPILKTQEIDVIQRGKLIGVGGMNLKHIYAKTGVTINLVDEKTISIFAPNEGALEDAEEMVRSFIEQKKEPELVFGSVYKAKIVSIVPGGLMVELYPNMKPALLPNNQLHGRKIVHASASEYKEGQEIQVKYFGRDPVDGSMRLSRKALFKTNLPAQDLIKK